MKIEFSEKKRRVVVTGLGAITPLAIGVEESWHFLLEGRSGITKINDFDTTNMRTKIAGQIKNFNPGDFMDRRFEKRFDRSINLAVASSIMAVKDSGLILSEETSNKTAVVIGNSLGGIALLEKNINKINKSKNSRISSYLVPGTLPSMISGLVAICISAKGPNFAINAACASGAHAIGEGFRLLQRGECDRAVVGGSEAAITRIMFLGYDSMKATSKRNDEPEKASRPFDKNRDGFVPAEGSGILILEDLSSAIKRNAKIYAEIIGYGSSCDAFHVTAPDPEADGPAKSMLNALSDAGLSPCQIDCINAHGTSTELNDISETKAIKRVFDKESKRVPVTSNKSMTGHMIGATGAVESIFSILSIRDGIIPATINYDTPDPQCDLDYVPNSARKMDVGCILSNSFGFGGNNASLIFKKFE